MKVLIVEDEPNVASFIARGLAEAGHEPHMVHTGREGLNLASSEPFDAVVLDLILPDMTGLEVCLQFRDRKGYDTPVIMLTALGSTEDVVKGLQTGADDYLVKPFKFRELLARLEAHNRHRKAHYGADALKVGDLEIDTFRRIVRRDGQLIRLTAREYELLVYLMRHAGGVVSREAILASVWGMDWDVETNVVDVYINYLRNKVDKPFPSKLIQTVIGMGYILTEEEIG